MLTTLKRIVQELNRAPELEVALQQLVSMVKQAMQVDSCSLYLADYDAQHFQLRATDGLAQAAVGQVNIGFAEGLIGLVGQREEPLNIENAHQHPRFKHYAEVQEENYYAFLGTPIIYQRKVLGVITMQHRDLRRFNEDEEAFLVTLATQIALEIANAEKVGQLTTENNLSSKVAQQRLQGIPSSSGLAMGLAYAPPAEFDISKLANRRCSDPLNEIEAYRFAVSETIKEVQALSKSLGESLPDDVQQIFTVYESLLDANSLGREVEAKIKTGWQAKTALKLVVLSYADRFREMQDAYMRERATDIIDVANRMLKYLSTESQSIEPPSEGFILVAHEVTATMLADMARKKLLAVISMRGSQNSHAAIMCRALGLPAVMGLGSVLPDLLAGQTLCVDAYAGEIIVSPSPHQADIFAGLIDEERLLDEKITLEGSLPTITKDNHEIALMVNAGFSAALEINDQDNLAGVGLFRTEIVYMMRDSFPSEQEQTKLYHEILHRLPHKEIVLRTLDIGGDKPLSYFPIDEENPFLGWRGVRLTLDHPEIFLVQLKAMIRASADLQNLQVLIPMVTSVNEVIEARRFLQQAYLEVREEMPERQFVLPQLGVMLEVPAIIYQLPSLAQHVDFFSVGSNDLTQYLLAVDRNNARVSELYDSYHPAVLHALNHIAQQAKNHKVPLSLCGEFAADPGGAILLAAMGYQKLSMNAHNLRKINWVLRSISLYEAEDLLYRVLNQADAKQNKAIINLFLEEHGLAGLIRAGG